MGTTTTILTIAVGIGCLVGIVVCIHILIEGWKAIDKQEQTDELASDFPYELRDRRLLKDQIKQAADAVRSQSLASTRESAVGGGG